MNLEPLKPVPTPLTQRLRDARTRLIPPIAFIGAMFIIALVWKDTVGAPTMIGLAEPIISNVSSYQAGVLTELNVRRFERVRAGQVIGKVIVADPELLHASLGVIRSEIEELQTDPQRIFTERRYVLDYARLRLDNMKQRADLATAKVNLHYAEADYRRNEALFTNSLLSQTEFQLFKSTRDALRQQVDELSQLVQESQTAFGLIQTTNQNEFDLVSNTLAWQEARLRLAEAEFSPIILKAPIDGIVTVVSNHPGESVTAGRPIVTIATLTPVRIVGYLRSPFTTDPQIGARVEVRTRGGKRRIVKTTITEVGTQLEALPLMMQSPLRFATMETGLPVEIALPASLHLRAGELVDISILAN
jgi:multidrug resistance efflux pump